MIIKSPITTDLNIDRLEDLYKLKLLMETTNMKINKTSIRETHFIGHQQIQDNSRR